MSGIEGFLREVGVYHGWELARRGDRTDLADTDPHPSHRGSGSEDAFDNREFFVARATRSFSVYRLWGSKWLLRALRHASPIGGVNAGTGLWVTPTPLDEESANRLALPNDVDSYSERVLAHGAGFVVGLAAPLYSDQYGPHGKGVQIWLNRETVRNMTRFVRTGDAPIQVSS